MSGSMSRLRVKHIGIDLTCLLFLIFCSGSLVAQVKISGRIFSAEETVAGARIDLRKKDANGLVGYTFSDRDGRYELETTEKGSLVLQVKTLTHQDLIQELLVSQTDVVLDLHLKHGEPQILEEVIVNAKRPGRLNRDTIELDVQSFLQGNEKNVEDLLKKIPGLTVGNDGSIKVGQKEVEKVMVEGDDFFEKGYRLLTQNMSVRPLDKVQVLQRYSNNKHLKGIEHSDKVALNLTLKEDSKSEWIGNLNGSSTFFGDSFYNAHLTLMNFGKKNKYFLLGSANNNGEDAVSSINHLIYSDQRDEAGQVGLGITTPTLLDNTPSLPGLSYTRTNFNRDQLVSLNGIWNPSKKLKAKWLGFLNITRKRFYRQTEQSYQIEDLQFSNTEDYDFEKKIANYFSKWELQYDIDQKSTIHYTGTIGSLRQQDIGELRFNGDPSVERTKKTGYVTNHNLSYSKKISDRAAFVSSARYIAQHSPLAYSIDKFYYADLFSTDSITDVYQDISNNLHYFGVNSSYLLKQRNGNYMQVALSSEHATNQLHTGFFLRSADQSVQQPAGFSNRMDFLTNQQNLQLKYTFKYKKLEWTPQLQSTYLYNRLQSYRDQQTKANLLFSPQIHGKWAIKSKRIVEAIVMFQQSNSEVMDIIPNYYTTGLRNFVKGMDDMQTLSNFGTKLNYIHGSMLDKFFAILSVGYNNYYDYLSQRSTIDLNYNLTEQILLKDKRSAFYKAEFNFYIKPLQGNLKLDAAADFSQYETEVTGIGNRAIQAQSQQYALSFRSAWKYWLNLEASSSVRVHTFRSETRNQLRNTYSHLNLFTRITDKTRVSLKNEAYRFNDYVSSDPKTYYFSDLSLLHELKKHNISLELVAKNIFDIRQFENAVVTDTYRSVTAYRLLPRYISIGGSISF